MTNTQIILFAIFGILFLLLLWGRWRYDLVAFAVLIGAVIVGVVPTEDAFDGFGHPAVVIIALVLVISRGLMNSGAVELLTKAVIAPARGLATHIAIICGLGASLSAVINNVAALALLMPVDIHAAKRAGRGPGLTLMPLSFATILGGMITLIGTPPNIIIASFREQALGTPFSMFDFTPVGLACTAAGLLFVAFLGWRLIPKTASDAQPGDELFEIEGYIVELKVTETSLAIGQKVGDLDDIAEGNDTVVLGLIRRGKRLPGQGRRVEIRKNDVLVVEGAPAAIDALTGALKLKYIGQEKHGGPAASGMSLIEVVVAADARIEGRSADSVRLKSRHAVALLGISREGRPFRERVRKLTLKAGDVLLLHGPTDRLSEVVAWTGCLPLAERGLSLIRRDMALWAASLFVVAVLAASVGWVYLPVALGAVVVGYVLLDIVPLRSLYEHIEWPVIILLAALIPLGGALEKSGGTALIAQAILDWTAGGSPVMVLLVLMIVTMVLSDVLNNTATALISAPIALDLATKLNVSPDPFLMAVAVAASCAFLTPIGHKNNTLILGPGGYHFGDYWRMGLPLEVIIVAVSMPVILWVWPL